MRKVLIDNSNTTLEQLLGTAGVELEEYMTALQMSSKGNTLLGLNLPKQLKFLGKSKEKGKAVLYFCVTRIHIIRNLSFH